MDGCLPGSDSETKVPASYDSISFDSSKAVMLMCMEVVKDKKAMKIVNGGISCLKVMCITLGHMTPVINLSHDHMDLSGV